MQSPMVIWALEQGLPTFGGNNRHGPKTGAGKRQKKHRRKMRHSPTLLFALELSAFYILGISRQRIAEAEYLMNVVGTEVVLFRLLI